MMAIIAGYYDEDRHNKNSKSRKVLLEYRHLCKAYLICHDTTVDAALHHPRREPHTLRPTVPVVIIHFKIRRSPETFLCE